MSQTCGLSQVTGVKRKGILGKNDFPLSVHDNTQSESAECLRESVTWAGD